MENLKIRVNSEAESKEVQELFFELGSAWISGPVEVRYTDSNYLYLRNGAVMKGDCDEDFNENKNYKEITLPQLRDLVVLKRNSIDDATHEDKNDPEFKYRLIDNHWYVITEGNPVWRKDSIDLNKAPLFIKPIEKPMKEYLIKSGDGKYLLTHHDSIGAIEIPGGAEKLTARGLELIFWTACGNYSWHTENSVEWDNNKELGLKSFDQYFDNETVILWQRHTHPEELPFIDDEPLQSLNDQYAEIEKVRQDIINSPGHHADSTIECIDAMEAMMTPEQFIGYLRGNVFKYQWRYEKKNGIEDLKKAQWYLDKLVSKVNEKHSFF